MKNKYENKKYVLNIKNMGFGPKEILLFSYDGEKEIRGLLNE